MKFKISIEIENLLNPWIENIVLKIKESNDRISTKTSSLFFAIMSISIPIYKVNNH